MLRSAGEPIGDFSQMVWTNRVRQVEAVELAIRRSLPLHLRSHRTTQDEGNRSPWSTYKRKQGFRPEILRERSTNEGIQ